MKVVSVPNGDYKLVVRKGNRNPSNPEYGGNITLDVGTADREVGRGTVYITGNLVVEGKQTTVESETATIKDNIIILNAGEPGNGVTLNTSGIQIDRGNLVDTAFVFDESVSHLSSTGASVAGTFTFVNNSNALIGIQTCSINTRGQNLYLINAPGNGYVSVTGTTDYEKNALDYTQYWPTYPLGTPTYTGPITITQDDAIPNAKAMGDFLTSSLYFFDDWRISEANTNVSVYDSAGGNTYRPAGYTPPATSNISFTVDGSERGKFTPLGLDVDRINLFGDTVKNTTNNLILTATTTNTVEVNALLQLNNQASDITVPAATATKIYTKAAEGPGRTGIYFTNDTAYGANAYNNDELVSRNRAVLLSILL